ncbi:hypothetical protein HYR69_10065, partial [Candidatus Sumerlaeota bacterium]|nr:hypothetical protein [Candidatus Sumerlaeota bacterium]
MGWMCAWGIFVFSAWLARAEGEISAERKNYDNDAVFEQLSGAKRAILEQKFGPKTKGTSQAPPSAPRSAKPPQPPISPLALPANTQVNNPAADATTQDTQSETALVLGSGSNIVAAFNDSGSNVGGVTKFTGFARSTNGGTSFTDM